MPVTLVERAGRLVTKAELLDQVWPGVVVEENNIAAQVSALRKVLGGDTIATIPGRGYRFTALVEKGRRRASCQRDAGPGGRCSRRGGKRGRPPLPTTQTAAKRRDCLQPPDWREGSPERCRVERRAHPSRRVQGGIKPWMYGSIVIAVVRDPAGSNAPVISAAPRKPIM